MEHGWNNVKSTTLFSFFATKGNGYQSIASYIAIYILVSHDGDSHNSYPLVNVYIAIENGPVEIVDLPIKNGDFQ